MFFHLWLNRSYHVLFLSLEDNAEDLLAAGAMKELARISRESSNEEIRYLAKRTLKRKQF